MKEENRPTIGTAEVAEIFGVTKDTVSGWCREKDPRKEKFPGAYHLAAGYPWFIPVDEVEALKKKRGIA